jgi:hypothetical protein
MNNLFYPGISSQVLASNGNAYRILQEGAC